MYENLKHYINSIPSATTHTKKYETRLGCHTDVLNGTHFKRISVYNEFYSVHIQLDSE